MENDGLQETDEVSSIENENDDESIEKENPVLDAIIAVFKKLKGSHLSNTVLQEADKEIERVQDFIGGTKNQAILFALFFSLYNQNSREVSLSEAAEYAGETLLYMLRYAPVVDALVERELLTVAGDDGEKKYTVSTAVFTCIITNHPFQKDCKKRRRQRF